MNKIYISLLLAVLVILPAGVMYAQFQRERFSSQMGAFSCYSSKDRSNVVALSGSSLNNDFVECAGSGYHSLNMDRQSLFRKTINFLLGIS